MPSEESGRNITTQEFGAAIQRLEELVQEFDALPFPDVRENIFEALKNIDTLHRESLRRLIAFIHEQGHAELVLRAAHDPAVRTLLELYDFMPSEDDASTLGTSQGRSIAEPIMAAREFIPLDKLSMVRRPVFTVVAWMEDIPLGEYRVFDVDRTRVLIANVDGEIYAVRNNCPDSAAPLNLGRFTSPLIICPWHNETWDIRTGRRADGQPGPNLHVLPVVVSDGAIKLAVDTAIKLQTVK